WPMASGDAVPCGPSRIPEHHAKRAAREYGECARWLVTTRTWTARRCYSPRMGATSYVCLLRGVNVSGKNLLKMAELRDACVAIGLRDVETYLQSGNVVFSAGEAAPERLAKKIVAMIDAEFGLSVRALVKSAAELAAIVKKNPFTKEKGIDPTKLH